MKTCPALRDKFSNELRNLGRLVIGIWFNFVDGALSKERGLLFMITRQVEFSASCLCIITMEVEVGLLSSNGITGII